MKYRVDFKDCNVWHDCQVSKPPLAHMVGFVELAPASSKPIIMNLSEIRSFTPEGDENETETKDGLKSYLQMVGWGGDRY